MVTDPRVAARRLQAERRTVVAARVSGNATSAFPDGPPAGVTAAPDALKASAKPLNVVVIADTDLLSDFMWVQQSNFFGQVIVQPFANNGELVWNAIDNLGGSNDLISIRGRAPVLAALRPGRRAAAQRRRTASAPRKQQLENELQQTEATLSKLQTAQPEGGNDACSPTIRRARSNASRNRSCASARNCAPPRPASSRTSSRSACEDEAHQHAHHAADRHRRSACWWRCGASAGAMPSPCCAKGARHEPEEIHRSLAGTAVVLLVRGRVALHAPLEPAVRPGRRQRFRRSQARARRGRRRSACPRATAAAPRCASDADGWTVVERQYPADAARVRELALSLASLQGRRTQDQRPG